MLKEHLDRLRLERTVDDGAQTGLFSLPLPPEYARTLTVNHPRSAGQPLAWRERDGAPRRVLVALTDKSGVPDELGVTVQPAADSRKRSPWKVATRITREKLDYIEAAYTNIDEMRGVPPENCVIAEGTLDLAYGGKQISITVGATGPCRGVASGEDGPDGGRHVWQNVQLDRLWANPAAEAIRVGGIVYNGDTFLQVDLFLILFANGVVRAACHFVNAKLHIRGYDFRGLPFIRFAGPGFGRGDMCLPADGLQHTLGPLSLNLADAGQFCSETYPGRLHVGRGRIPGSPGADRADWFPFHRVFNAQKPHGPPDYWDPGMARTVRFNFALGTAPAAIARYRVPAWWYGVCGEPWTPSVLPVDGRFTAVGDDCATQLRKAIRRGRFDAGSASKPGDSTAWSTGNDGYTGTSLLLTAYRTGCDGTYSDALAHCDYWADLAVDHTDFTIHQWVGGWPWKTCAYTKFRDILYGYLETGDPYLRDTAENTADAYWMWFRSNWPRAVIGRDMFPAGDWALMRRFLGADHGRERGRELLRMLQTLLETRGQVGVQMGGGPHPSYLSSLYMTGVCMTACLEMAEAEDEAGESETLDDLYAMLKKMHPHFIRNDVELFPSNAGQGRPDWPESFNSTWAMQAGRIYPAMQRLWPEAARLQRAGMALAYRHADEATDDWGAHARVALFPIEAAYHDALMLGARLAGKGIVIEPIGAPKHWPPAQDVHTPWGRLTIRTTNEGGKTELAFSALARFPVTVRCNDRTTRTTSRGRCRL